MILSDIIGKNYHVFSGKNTLVFNRNKPFYMQIYF